MTTYNTGNAIGSTDPRDLFDNAQNLDELVNSATKTSLSDRLGTTRKTWKGIEDDFDAFLLSSGYQLLGDYAAGVTFTAYNQIVRTAGDSNDPGEFWRPAANTELPYTTTGAGVDEGGALVTVGDANLRQELASTASGKGSALVNFSQGIKSSTASTAWKISEQTGLVSKRLRLGPNDTAGTGSAEIELVPGDTVSHSGLESQILLFGNTGTDYERFVISMINSEVVIDSTANNSGTPRNIVFEMGGKVTPSIASQKAMILYSDASVDLNGSSFTADSQTWGVTRTRIADAQNSGDTRLIIDTRTGTPADNSADDCFVEFRRGGTWKLRAGLNVSANNEDSFDITTAAGATWRIKQDGDMLVGGNVDLPDATDVYKVGGSQVLGARVTGWTQATGTATRTTFATSTVTLEQLAERVKALIDDGFTHGFIGP